METTAARDEGILIYFLITDCKKLRMYCDPHTRLTEFFVLGKCMYKLYVDFGINYSIIGKH